MNASKGFFVATAVAVLFMNGTIGAKAEDKASADQVKCSGINECKGQGACAGPGSSCSGQNTCKGKGIVMVTKADCAKKGGKVVE